MLYLKGEKILEKVIEVKSHWGVNIKNEYIIQDKDTLVVILPGGRYTTFGLLLYYSYNVSLQSGYDVLGIDYGFQKTDKDVELNEITYSCLVKETEEAIRKCLNEKKYKKIIFIGKCLGTYIQIKLISKFNNYKQKHVFLTPWADCIEGIISTNSMVIVGTNDICFDKEHISKIVKFENVTLKTIEGANHDLEKEDYKESLEILKEVSEYIYDFINDKI